jgi:branched-chain amino acid transport system ATP-binding protein
VVEGVVAHRGPMQVLHGVDLHLAHEPLAVLGRNGAGKTTLCHAIMGLLPVSRGSIRFDGHELVGKSPDAVAGLGVSIVPQGRRVFPSLTVDEHMRLMARRATGPWDVSRIYRTFPRLAERKGNYGNQLSGGEQQMLAISRSLLLNPRLLILDEPSEGLAPLIVEQLLQVLRALADEGTSILLVEQKLRVGTSAARQVAIMSAGQIAHVGASEQLLQDEALQHQYLGVSGEGETA